MNALRSLTQEQRQTAREAARKALTRRIGDRPTRDQFDHHTASAYPTQVTRLITAICVVLLLAAFTPSAIRLFVIGSQTFSQVVNSTVAAHLVGLATVLIAESGQIGFSLALATLGTSRSARRLLYASMGLATSIALVGNIQVALPNHSDSPFAWLDAVAPPLLVLSTAYVLKEQMLDAIRRRHANEQAFQTALAAWLSATADPEHDPRWTQIYANALRDELRRVNAHRREVLAAMTTADWNSAVWGEMQADEWYNQPQEQPVSGSPFADLPTLGVGGNGNGHH